MEQSVLQNLREVAAVMEDVEQVAKETRHPIAVARKIYETECARLKDDATVTEYLTVLALRHTREVLYARQAARRSSAEERSYDLFAA